MTDPAAASAQSSFDPSSLPLTFDEEFNSLNLQQQGQGAGWATDYAWDSYNSESAHTIFGESEIYVDPTFAGTGSTALGLNPFSISNGVLSIHAAQTPSADQGLLWGHAYTSGVLTTVSSFTQTYGYFEMRAQLPSGQGAFPAFWLLSADGKYNEIDVMEAVNGQDQAWQHLHYTPAGATSQSGFESEVNVPGMSTGFHTYGLLWTAQNITWYIDGTAVASTATPAVMNSPMYMLVDYAVGGSWAGAPNGSPLTDMQVDYVRAYSLSNAPSSITGVAANVATNITIDGTAGADVLSASGGANVRGLDGNDTIIGAGAPNVINGNDGNDSIVGGPSGDDLFGGKGDDTIVGGPGNDTISGDLGNDILYGGGGANDFLFRPGSGHDWIADFSFAQGDKVVLPTGTAYSITSYQNQVVVELGNGDELGLVGVSPAQLPAHVSDWLTFN